MIRLLLLCATFTFAQGIIADINDPNSRVFWDGTLGIRLGKTFALPYSLLSGFLEVQNEERFNQGLLPNHKWRGVLQWQSQIALNPDSSWTLPIGFQHESAHASMGIQEPTSNAYELIYDGQYRNINRNVISLGLIVDQKHPLLWRLQANALGYLFSRNTPEAPNTQLTQALGANLGAQCEFKVASFTSFVSVWYRKEFMGFQRQQSSIYIPSNDSYSIGDINYPLFNSTQTFSMLVAIAKPIGQLQYGLYMQYLYGNFGGFVDSRSQQWKIQSGIFIK